MTNEPITSVDISRCPTLLALAGPPPQLALPKPPLRVPASEVPTTFDGFRAWSEWACTEWPGPLQVEAYYAMEGLQLKKPDARRLLRKFLDSYNEWLALPEREKFSWQNPEHEYRLFYLQRAREAMLQARR